MLTIYGSDLSGPCNKVRFVANDLGFNYEYRRMNLRDGEQKQEWFLKINPIGKVPAIDDNGFCLFESGAICKYMCDQKGSSLYPKDLKQRATVEQWTDFVNLHMAANMMKVVYNRVFAPLRHLPVNQESIDEGLKFLAQYFPVIEARLAKNKFIVGNALTLADMTLLAALDPVEMAQVGLEKYPKLTAWRQGLKSQTFYTQCHKEYGESLKQAAPR
ncbi:MAG: glutathione S-transferase family protein [Candidatus Omnitrophica bacterium]|nr:glutathione S-transferase family protein [Candidatus Omnitrophota bacterium]